MARKVMRSVRLDPVVAAKVDELAKAAGQDRSEWISAAVARAALTSSGRPQPVHEVGDERTTPAP